MASRPRIKLLIRFLHKIQTLNFMSKDFQTLITTKRSVLQGVSRGSPVGLPWVSRGSRVGLAWISRGSPVGLPWVSRGSHVASTWLPRGSQGDPRGISRGPPVDPAGFHGGVRQEFSKSNRRAMLCHCVDLPRICRGSRSGSHVG